MAALTTIALVTAAVAGVASAGMQIMSADARAEQARRKARSETEAAAWRENTRLRRVRQALAANKAAAAASGVRLSSGSTQAIAGDVQRQQVIEQARDDRSTGYRVSALKAQASNASILGITQAATTLLQTAATTTSGVQSERNLQRMRERWGIPE